MPHVGWSAVMAMFMLTRCLVQTARCENVAHTQDLFQCIIDSLYGALRCSETMICTCLKGWVRRVHSAHRHWWRQLSTPNPPQGVIALPAKNCLSTLTRTRYNSQQKLCVMLLIIYCHYSALMMIILG